MRIGEDVSIQECRDQGYLVMDYPAYKFKKNPTTTYCRFTDSWPHWYREERGYGVGDPIIRFDMEYNWEDLWEIYQDYKKGIDSMIGGSHKYTLNPEPHEVLNLASDINSYCGLE